jgi:hypothetical protein
MATITNRVNTVFTADGAQFHKTVAGVQSAVTGLKGMLVGALGAVSIGSIVKSMLDFGDNIQTTANNLNVSTDSAQRFAYAARNANVEMGAFQKTLGTFDNLMAKWKGGSLDATKVGLLKRLGLSEADFDAKPDELLFKALKSTQGQSREEVQGIFQQLGIKGKAAGQIIGNREDILANDIPIVSEDVIGQLDALGDAFSNLKEALIVGLIPSFIESARMLMDVVKQVVDYFASESKRTDKMEELAGNDGVAPMGMMERGAAFITETTQNAMLATGFMKVGSKADDFMTEKLNTFRYGKDWRKYVDAGAEAAAEKSPFQIAIDKLVENLKKDTTPKKKMDSVREPIFGKDKVTKPFQNNLGPLESNEFMKIGGFLGTDVQYRLSRLSEEANDLLARIATATETLANEPTNEAPEQDLPV